MADSASQTMKECRRRTKFELRFGHTGYSVFNVPIGYQVEITSVHLGIWSRIKQRNLIEKMEKKLTRV